MCATASQKLLLSNNEKETQTFINIVNMFVYNMLPRKNVAALPAFTPLSKAPLKVEVAM